MAKDLVNLIFALAQDAAGVPSRTESCTPAWRQSWNSMHSAIFPRQNFKNNLEQIKQANKTPVSKKISFHGNQSLVL